MFCRPLIDKHSVSGPRLEWKTQFHTGMNNKVEENKNGADNIEAVEWGRGFDAEVTKRL